MIIEHSSRGSIPVEGGYILYCTAKGWGKLEYLWERRTEYAWTPVGKGITHTTTNPGLYRCIVINRAGYVESGNIAVTVKGQCL